MAGFFLLGNKIAYSKLESTERKEMNFSRRLAGVEAALAERSLVYFWCTC